MLLRNTRCLHLRLSRRGLFQMTQGSGSSSRNIDPAAIYVAANRSGFYKAMGVFCMIQASAWGILTGYLLRRHTVTWEVLSEDFLYVNSRIANFLESITPTLVKKLVLRKKDETSETIDAESLIKAVTLDQPDLPQDEELQANAAGHPSQLEASIQDFKQMSSKIRASFGLSDSGQLNSNGHSTRAMMPLLTGTMCVFTVFAGGLIPRRVIRRISLVPPKGGKATTKAADPILCVSTYGYFGLLPREPRTLIPITGIHATRPFNEGEKFMNLRIIGHPFTYYLEKYDAEFLLAEYFHHLNERALLDMSSHSSSPSKRFRK